MKNFARGLLILAFSLSSCTSTDFYLVKNEGVTRIMGAQFRVCKTRIRFQETGFTVEGLQGPSAAQQKVFQVSKIGITASQAKDVSTVALIVDSLQEEMCETTRDLALRSGDAYDKYVAVRDARLESLALALSNADSAVKSGTTQDKITADLQAALGTKDEKKL